MHWDKDSLLAKAKLYFQRAFYESHDDPLFGFWCSLGLELLARAAVASVSPTLLAEPQPDHKHLLYALNQGTSATPTSIKTSVVLKLCQQLFKQFTEEDFKAANALVNARNEELHSGASTFSTYTTSQWLTGFYRVCDNLCNALHESLEGVLGAEEASGARFALKVKHDEVDSEVKSAIGRSKHAFEQLPEEKRQELAAKAAEQVALLVHAHHHKVKCPSCGSDASVQGATYGVAQVSLNEDFIETRQPVSPKSFACIACGLKLEGYTRLDVAGVGGHYTRTTSESPEDYYGLVDPDNIDLEELMAERYSEYDNE